MAWIASGAIDCVRLDLVDGLDLDLEDAASTVFHKAMMWSSDCKGAAMDKTQEHTKGKNAENCGTALGPTAETIHFKTQPKEQT